MKTLCKVVVYIFFLFIVLFIPKVYENRHMQRHKMYSNIEANISKSKLQF